MPGRDIANGFSHAPRNRRVNFFWRSAPALLPSTRMERFAFWLEPAAEEKRFFASLIRDLAQRFDAPIFEPHLTLCGALSDHDHVLQLLRNVAARPRYELEIDSAQASEQFTKTLFVRLRSSMELHELRRAINRADGEFDPHLSLLYKEMPMVEKNALAKSIAIPFQRVTFTELSVIAHPEKISTREDVESWRVLARRSLCKSSR